MMFPKKTLRKSFIYCGPNYEANYIPMITKINNLKCTVPKHCAKPILNIANNCKLSFFKKELQQVIFTELKNIITGQHCLQMFNKKFSKSVLHGFDTS